MKFIALALACAAVWAGTEPRPLPADYPLHRSLPHADIGVEYCGKAISQGTDSYFVGNYLVVEVAIYPEKDLTLPLAGHEFHLRLNGSTRELSPDSPGLVAGRLRNPGWDQYRGPQASVGVGPGAIIVGGPPRAGRFPGDPDGTGRTLPRAPEDRPDKAPGAVRSAEEAVEKYAFEDGPASGPRSGLLYFAWDGKMKSLRSIQLVYDGAAGRAVFTLK